MGTDIKICGLTRSVDAEYADAAGVEYLGVIFAGGPRERTPTQARDTLAGRRARKAGVFADQAEDVIASIVEVVGLDVVQLHGSVDAERVERVRAATGKEVWAVVRTSDGALPDDVDELADASDALLIDAHVAGQLGGSGVRVPWDRLGESLDALDYHPRIVLAGGLTPENVEEAIDLVAPNVVDISSGVESSPGIKDQARLRAFVAAVRSAGVKE
ncbi:MAG TPA: phosphoribosylanthranilate isomerase [Gemmatimonadaceae bacterium]|nr:phosphoribosylanthranilate isomerase [Gemmatimonadaceae bacterium]